MQKSKNSLKDLIQISSKSETGHSTKILQFSKDKEVVKDLAKKRHDIEAALETFKLALDSIKKGYRFDDSAANSKIEYLEKSLKTLQVELDFFKSLLVP